MKTEGCESDVAGMELEAVLRETIEALSRLDAGRIEELAEEARRLGARGPAHWPESAAEWRRAAASYWVLGHLVGATARQLAVQRRIMNRLWESGGAYRGDPPEDGARLAARMNAALAWAWPCGGAVREAGGESGLGAEAGSI